MALICIKCTQNTNTDYTNKIKITVKHYWLIVYTFFWFTAMVSFFKKSLYLECKILWKNVISKCK